ncbi:NACHT domain-containing protein [Shewanella baltica]|uniref:NACHT domain-containing protein n=1 Tax=Shewanella baltica TaxID=62322 RepID=UPI0039AEEFCD
MNEKEKIIQLYKKYGFEFRKNVSNGNFLAFTFKSGFFHNAEIVSLNSKEKENIEHEMDKVSSQLESLGFSTKKAFYKNFEEIEKTLFDGFFNVSEWKKKIQLEYKSHCERTLSVLPDDAANYSYIKVPYLKNNKKENEDLIKDICESLQINGPQLNIIEAPAGFGKTCTSYEIINNLVNNYKNAPIPFFTEFSRDRQARVFSHIFVREVDRSFNSVNSDVVIDEVKQGKIVVVLDGFDELLHDKGDSRNETTKFENAEPMLETIGELLTNNAKIILTSRRSAIFDGEMFNDWINRYENKFSINRYKLEKPEVQDWITSTRLEKLKNTPIDINNLSNPVLLSFLRFVSDSKFESLCQEPSKIVEQYFSSMLNREMDRQELRMNPEQQMELLKLVAEDMCDNNYTSDSKEKIIKVIKERGAELLNNVRTLYSHKDRPTIDKLATTLSNHAFFDRSNQGENNIQFINEFVFGNYIAESITSSNEDWIASDERFVEPAVLSYMPRSCNQKNILWNKLSTMKEFLDLSTRMKFEAILTGNIEDNVYSKADITSINIKNLNIFQFGKISSSIFNECTFNHVNFNLDNFEDVTFLNCLFWDCKYNFDEQPQINFYNCRDNNNFIENIEELEDTDELTPQPNIAHYIFSKIWPIGSQSIDRLHYFTNNLFKTDEFSKKEISKEIKRLKQEDFILGANDVNFITINKTKIVEIKEILGRNRT